MYILMTSDTEMTEAEAIKETLKAFFTTVQKKKALSITEPAQIQKCKPGHSKLFAQRCLLSEKSIKQIVMIIGQNKLSVT